MSELDFERNLRDRMRERAAEMDRTARPAPPLRTLLAGGRSAPRRSFSRVRLAVAAAAVAAAAAAVLAIAQIAGGPANHGLSGGSPLLSVTPTPSPALVTLSPSPSTPAPDPAESPSPTVAVSL